MGCILFNLFALSDALDSVESGFLDSDKYFVLTEVS